VAASVFGVLSVPAFAKEKLVFGTFVASVEGHAPTGPTAVKENKEDVPDLTGLQLGQYRFGKINEENGKPEYEEPCLKPPKVTGTVTEERSSSLLTEIDFKQCVSEDKTGGVTGHTTASFKLAVRFIANESAEIGKPDGIEIAKTASVSFKGAQPCVVEIPNQFVPAKSGEKPEKEWEAATYTGEAPEEVENWEKNKKLKEEYPTGFKLRLEIETTERFKGIVSYVDTVGNEKKGCTPTKGEENGKYITEKEIEVEGKMVPNPHYHWTEFKNGFIAIDVEGLEIKDGELTFEPPPA
jgi:hypothetical protein